MTFLFIVEVTAALVIESLAVLLYCGLLYHLSSPRHPQYNQAPSLPPFFQNMLNTIMKTRKCTMKNPRNRKQRDSGIYEDGNRDVVDMMFGSDETCLIDRESELVETHSKLPNGDPSIHQDNNGAELTKGVDRTEDTVAEVGKGQLETNPASSNFALVILMNRIGLAVFAFAFAVELLIIMVI